MKPLVIMDRTKCPGLILADFTTADEDAAWPDPVKYWCQDNHILIITEGASTADVNAVVQTFIDTNGHHDADARRYRGCLHERTERFNVS